MSAFLGPKPTAPVAFSVPSCYAVPMLAYRSFLGFGGTHVSTEACLLGVHQEREARTESRGAVSF